MPTADFAMFIHNRGRRRPCSIANMRLDAKKWTMPPERLESWAKSLSGFIYKKNGFAFDWFGGRTKYMHVEWVERGIWECVCTYVCVLGVIFVEDICERLIRPRYVVLSSIRIGQKTKSTLGWYLVYWSKDRYGYRAFWSKMNVQIGKQNIHKKNTY